MFEGAVKVRRVRRREKGRHDEKVKTGAKGRGREKLVAISAGAPARTESNPMWITHELEPEQENEQERDQDSSSRAASPSPSPAPRALWITGSTPHQQDSCSSP